MRSNSVDCIECQFQDARAEPKQGLGLARKLRHEPVGKTGTQTRATPLASWKDRQKRAATQASARKFEYTHALENVVCDVL